MIKKILKWIFFIPVSFIILAIADFVSLYMIYAVLSWSLFYLLMSMVAVTAIQIGLFAFACGISIKIAPNKTVSLILVGLPVFALMIWHIFNNSAGVSNGVYLYATISNVLIFSCTFLSMFFEELS